MTDTARADHAVTGYTFDVRGGAVIEDGRSYWPHVLSVRMNRQQAWNMAMTLLNQIQHNVPERPYFYLWTVGLLTENRDDDE